MTRNFSIHVKLKRFEGICFRNKTMFSAQTIRPTTLVYVCAFIFIVGTAEKAGNPENGNTNTLIWLLCIQ